jgi:hypothetical protein
MEDSRGHAIALALMEAAAGSAGDDARSILPAVLKQIQGVVYLYGRRLRLPDLLLARLTEPRVYSRLRVCVNHGDDATHLEGVKCEREGLEFGSSGAMSVSTLRLER